MKRSRKEAIETFSPKFLKSLQVSYCDYQRKGGVSLERFLAQTERDLAKLQR